MGTKDIAAILTERDAEKYAHIIVRAALNGYHDYKSDNIPGHPEYGYAPPKLQLVVDLAAYPELGDIRQRVINGDFDESPDDEDELDTWGMLMNTNAGDFMFKILGLQVPTQQDREAWKIKSKLN